MNFKAGKLMLATLAIGVALGGCATRESVRNAQGAADAADHHAMAAQGRADDAWTVGNNALGVGNDAKATSLTAAQKADQANADLAVVSKRVAYLEEKTLPHHKKKRHHRAAAPAPEQKPNNS